MKGGCNIKRFYGDRALSIFIQPPSVEELRRRLVGRQTDSAEAIENRLAKASEELTFAEKFDKIIVNDDLEKAKQETYKVVKAFLTSPPKTKSYNVVIQKEIEIAVHQDNINHTENTNL